MDSVPKWFWALLLAAIAWGVRVEYRDAQHDSRQSENAKSASEAKQEAENNRALINTLATVQAERSHNTRVIGELANEVRSLRETVVELTVEVRHLKEAGKRKP